MKRFMTLTGLQLIRLQLSEVVYWHMQCRGLVREKSNRNDDIRNRYENGATLTEIGNELKISPQRIHQVIHYRNL